MHHRDARPSRRRFMLGAAAAMLGPRELAARPLPSRGEVSLKVLAARKSLTISTAYDGAPDRDIRSLIAHHCHLVTPENALKPGYVAPRGYASIAFDRMAGTAGFCRGHGLRLHVTRCSGISRNRNG